MNPAVSLDLVTDIVHRITLLDVHDRDGAYMTVSE